MVTDFGLQFKTAFFLEALLQTYRPSHQIQSPATAESAFVILFFVYFRIVPRNIFTLSLLCRSLKNKEISEEFQNRY